MAKYQRDHRARRDEASRCTRWWGDFRVFVATDGSNRDNWDHTRLARRLASDARVLFRRQLAPTRSVRRQWIVKPQTTRRASLNRPCYRGAIIVVVARKLIAVWGIRLVRGVNVFVTWTVTALPAPRVVRSLGVTVTVVVPNPRFRLVMYV